MPDNRPSQNGKEAYFDRYASLPVISEMIFRSTQFSEQGFHPFGNGLSVCLAGQFP